MRTINLIIKRLIDFFASLFGLILLLPFMIIVAVLIKLTSKGPIFYKQERLGRNGKKFKIIKFRTMVVNAENMGTGLFVKTEEDDRITKVGKILRATSLDELPQLFNVLIGDMSLVGPRPPVPNHPYKYNEYSNLQRKRFSMRPGMTGLAQIMFRNSVPWDERIKVDVQYVENFNLILDFKIMLKTFVKLFKRESIYLENYEIVKKKSSNY